MARLVKISLVVVFLVLFYARISTYYSTFYRVGECTTFVYTSSIPRLIDALGITVPRGTDGDSTIYIVPGSSRGLLKHELGHARQICEMKGWGWPKMIQYWMKNTKDMEIEAESYRRIEFWEIAK